MGPVAVRQIHWFRGWRSRPQRDTLIFAATGQQPAVPTETDRPGPGVSLCRSGGEKRQLDHDYATRIMRIRALAGCVVVVALSTLLQAQVDDEGPTLPPLIARLKVDVALFSARQSEPMWLVFLSVLGIPIIVFLVSRRLGGSERANLRRDAARFSLGSVEWLVGASKQHPVFALAPWRIQTGDNYAMSAYCHMRFADQFRCRMWCQSICVSG